MTAQIATQATGMLIAVSSTRTFHFPDCAVLTNYFQQKLSLARLPVKHTKPVSRMLKSVILTQTAPVRAASELHSTD